MYTEEVALELRGLYIYIYTVSNRYSIYVSVNLSNQAIRELT